MCQSQAKSKIAVLLAAAADKIVAQPGTLTGSIGVAYCRLHTSKLLHHMGIDHDHVTAGRNTLMSDGSSSGTTDQISTTNSLMDK